MSHMECGTYVFDRFEPAALGSKMCAQILVSDLAPSLGPTWSMPPMCSIGLKPPPPRTRTQNVSLNLCHGPSALIFTELLLIFCRNFSWVVLQCSAKFWPTCLRFRKMAAIQNRKITFFHFSPNLPWLFQRNFVDIARGKGMGVGSWTEKLNSVKTVADLSYISFYISVNFYRISVKLSLPA